MDKITLRFIQDLREHNNASNGFRKISVDTVTRDNISINSDVEKPTARNSLEVGQS